MEKIIREKRILELQLTQQEWFVLDRLFSICMAESPYSSAVSYLINHFCECGDAADRLGLTVNDSEGK